MLRTRTPDKWYMGVWDAFFPLAISLFNEKKICPLVSWILTRLRRVSQRNVVYKPELPRLLSVQCVGYIIGWKFMRECVLAIN